MDTHYLNSLFNPRAIALFGASSKPDSVGSIVFQNLLSAGYSGQVFPVNPKYSSIGEHKSYQDLGSVKASIDLAVVATPAQTLMDIVTDCGEHGIKMMIILTAGFREIGERGSLLEARLLEKARLYGIRIMGPNCLGLVRPSAKLNITFGNNNAKPGDLALVSQSGAICTAILDWAEYNDIGFSAVVSTGISADLDFGDYLDYLVSDPYTKSILLYIEGIHDARRFMSSLRAAARIKPVIVLKTGRHGEGSEASISHTGALSGNDETFSAALNRSGALRVMTINNLFTAAKVLSSRYRSASKRLLIITNGGGPGVMAADRAADKGLDLITINDELKKKLDGMLPAMWSRSNPADLLGNATAEHYGKTLEVCLQEPDIEGIIVILTPQAMTHPTRVAEVIIESCKTSNKPVLTSWMGGNQVEQARQLFQDARIPNFRTVENAVDAYSYLAAYKNNQQLLLQTPAKMTRGPKPPDLEAAKMIIESKLAHGNKILSETESFAILRAFDIPVVHNGIAHSADEALVIAETIGLPVVMKITSNTVTHKSDVGGVRLNINSAHEVRSAYQDLSNDFIQRFPEANLSGITIEKMYRGPNGRELIIGIIQDPVFGPVISFGSGGTHVEITDDTRIALPPLNRQLALDLINRTRVSKTLGQFRNLPPVNIDTLIDILLRISTLACELPWVQELDINPLIIDDNGAVAVDARIRVDYAPSSHDPYSHLAIHPYPAHLVNRIQLPSGTDILIRPIRPEDAEFEQEFIRNLSSEAKHFRFMSTLQELSQEMLVRFTQIDYHNEMAFVAIKMEGNNEAEEIGVARYVTNRDQRSCEFALVVSDQWQGKGIAHQLMNNLIQVARNRRLEQMEGDILSDNYKMLDLVRSLGFATFNDPDDLGIKHAQLNL